MAVLRLLQCCCTCAEWMSYCQECAPDPDHPHFRYLKLMIDGFQDGSETGGQSEGYPEGCSAWDCLLSNLNGEYTLENCETEFGGLNFALELGEPPDALDLCREVTGDQGVLVFESTHCQDTTTNCPITDPPPDPWPYCDSVSVPDGCSEGSANLRTWYTARVWCWKITAQLYCKIIVDWCEDLPNSPQEMLIFDIQFHLKSVGSSSEVICDDICVGEDFQNPGVACGFGETVSVCDAGIQKLHCEQCTDKAGLLDRHNCRSSKMVVKLPGWKCGDDDPVTFGCNDPDDDGFWITVEGRLLNQGDTP